MAFAAAPPPPAAVVNRKLLFLTLISLSLSFVFLSFSINPRTLLLTNHPTVNHDDDELRQTHHGDDDDDDDEYSTPPEFSRIRKPHWLEVLIPDDRIKRGERIKVGLVNIDDRELGLVSHFRRQVTAVTVQFQPASKDITWEDLFPEWIDEEERWNSPRCPDIPMPAAEAEDHRGLDVVVAGVACGTRDVRRLQVNLAVANVVVENMAAERKVYVVFVGRCGPMPELFRCDELVSHAGEFRVYKPELRRLREKVVMPVGSCQIAPSFAQTGEGLRRPSPSKVNQRKAEQEEAYVTVLHSSEAYVCGAVALARSIRLTNTTRDLILLHDQSISNTSLNGLRAAGWRTQLIQRIRSPFAKKRSYNEWNYSKLRVWQLIHYAKVIFVDSDFLILKNIDYLFMYPQLSAAGNNEVRFNSGIMLVEPSMCTFEEMMLKSFKVVPYNGGDQGFLNEFFTWWHRWPSSVNHLKIFPVGGVQDNKLEKVHAIHYLGLKPWMCYRDYDCNWDMEDHHAFASDLAHKKWWEVYDAMPKQLQGYCALTKRMVKRIEKWRGIANKSGLSDEHWKTKVVDPRQYRLLQ